MPLSSQLRTLKDSITVALNMLQLSLAALRWLHILAEDAYRSQGAGAGAGVALAVLGGSHDAAVGNNHNILAAELLLQLANQPLLDLVESLQQTVWDLKTVIGMGSQSKVASCHVNVAPMQIH